MRYADIDMLSALCRDAAPCRAIQRKQVRYLRLKRRCYAHARSPPLAAAAPARHADLSCLTVLRCQMPARRLVFAISRYAAAIALRAITPPAC